jgi:hypothetical protein
MIDIVLGQFCFDLVCSYESSDQTLQQMIDHASRTVAFQFIHFPYVQKKLNETHDSWLQLSCKHPQVYSFWILQCEMQIVLLNFVFGHDSDLAS